MKKFFEASVVTRKTVEGKVSLTVQAVSAEAKCLGRLTMKAYNEDSKSGLFFRYDPSPEAAGNEPIAAVKFLVEDQESLSLVLETIKEGIQQQAVQTGKLDVILTATILCGCIDSEAGQITIPSIASAAGVNITNDFIRNYVGDEWIGGEVKILPEVQEAIKKLADKKRLAGMM